MRYARVTSNQNRPSARDVAWALIVVFGLVAIAAILIYLNLGPKAA
jgi:hypothetical protein